MIADAPYDPHLPFLFFGEEVSMAARMWTRGYDLYAPDAPVLYHRYERDYRSTFWEGAATLDDAAALKVASRLAGGLREHQQADAAPHGGRGHVHDG